MKTTPKHNLKDLSPLEIVSLFTHFYVGGHKTEENEFMLEFMELSENYQSYILSKCTEYVSKGLKVKIMECRLELAKTLVMEAESPDKATSELATEDLIRMEIWDGDKEFVNLPKNQLIISFFK